MEAEVVGVDAVAVGFKAEEQQRRTGDGNGVAQRRLPGAVDVVVLVDRRIVAQQNELVGVAAIAEGRDGAAAQLLARGGEPALGALPRVVGAVELVGAEGAIA